MAPPRWSGKKTAIVAALAIGVAGGGVPARLGPTVDPAEAAGLLQRAGFVEPVAEVETLTLRYRSLADLARAGGRFFGSAVGAGDSGGIDGNLVGARLQQCPHIGMGSHAASNGQRHEAVRRRFRNDVEQRRAILMGGGDIEEHQLVGARRIIARGSLHRIAGVAQADEIHALHHPAVGNVEAGDDPHGKGHLAACKASASWMRPS